MKQLMYKITNLYRINLRNRALVLFYYLKKIAHISPTLNEKQIYELYNHLIVLDGKLLSETNDFFIVRINASKTKLKIRKSPSSDLMVFQQVYRGQEYQEVVNLFRQYFNKEAECIIDAGANVGYTSVFFNSVFKGVKYLVIEPSTENCNLIRDNFNFNNIPLNLYQGGLWNKNTYLKIVRDFRDQLDWAIRVEESSEKTDLKAFTVSHLIEESGVDYIDIFKMDIEGAEKQVFDTSMDLSFLNKVRCISVEIHDEFDCRTDIYSILQDKGFTLSNVGELTIGINHNHIDV